MPLVPMVVSGSVESVYGNVTSKTAQKAYIKTVLASFLAVLLLGLSCLGYILFYFNYIPQIGLETEVHLIYGAEKYSYTKLVPKLQKYAPYGTANISNGIIMHNQPYDIYISLTLPTSPRNIEAGNFMINLTLFDDNLENPVLLASSRRAACLTYKSGLIHTMDAIIRSPFYLSGWKREEETLDVLMMQGQKFAKNRVPGYLGIRLGNDAHINTPEAYEAKVFFKARFQGLRYFMYNYRIISFFTFTSLFWMTGLFWASVGWIFISSYFSSWENDHGDGQVQKPPPSATERRSVHPLAPTEDDSEEIPRPRGVYATPEATPAPEGHEGDDEEDSEDSRNYGDGLSEEGGRTPTSMDEHMMHGSAQDSGIGTSMGEARDGGLVRRRSNRRTE